MLLIVSTSGLGVASRHVLIACVFEKLKLAFSSTRPMVQSLYYSAYLASMTNPDFPPTDTQ